MLDNVQLEDQLHPVLLKDICIFGRVGVQEGEDNDYTTNEDLVFLDYKEEEEGHLLCLGLYTWEAIPLVQPCK